MELTNIHCDFKSLQISAETPTITERGLRGRVACYRHGLRGRGTHPFKSTSYLNGLLERLVS